MDPKASEQANTTPKVDAEYQKCCGLSNALSFHPASIRIASVKTIQNQYKHKIGRVITIIGIHRFLDHEPFVPLHLTPHVIRRYLDSSHSQIISTTRLSEKLVKKS
jgi:hypothetical protein